MENKVEPENQIASRLQPIIEQVGRYTVPLFSPPPDGVTVPPPLGSGILFRREEKFYLLTAGHCLKQRGVPTNAGVFLGKEFAVLPGRMIVDIGDDGKTDIGIAELDYE